MPPEAMVVCSSTAPLCSAGSSNTFSRRCPAGRLPETRPSRRNVTLCWNKCCRCRRRCSPPPARMRWKWRRCCSNMQPGDEVIVPSFTFVSTANAFVLRGARIVFADIRPDTLNLDESKLEATDHAAHESHRAGALRRRGLRDGRHPGNRPTAQGSRGGGQCPWPVRKIQGPLAGNLRRAGHPELSRDQEHLPAARAAPC